MPIFKPFASPTIGTMVEPLQFLAVQGTALVLEAQLPSLLPIIHRKALS
jgi:hypothetical protein